MRTKQGTKLHFGVAHRTWWCSLSVAGDIVTWDYLAIRAHLAVWFLQRAAQYLPP